MRLAAFFAMAACLFAAEPARFPLVLLSPVQDKNFYFFSMIERIPALRAAVHNDPALARIAAARLADLDSASKTCAVNVECYAKAFTWTPEQTTEAGQALAALYRVNPAVHAFADGALRDTGMYMRYNNLPSEELLQRAWTDCATGINHILDVYALGKPPRYPAVDVITYSPKEQLYPRVLENITLFLAEDRAALDLFFSPSLRFALETLTLNDRDEAGRFEPMDRAENLAAFQRVRGIDWTRYPYSAIVVPGSGNDRPGPRISPAGRVRDEIAAKRFREGKAPFIIVSGGFVHPNQTEYAEALEMKHDLMARFNIPAEAIIIEPHARHTTTNMRNAARLIYRYGIPFEKPALVTTDTYQSKYIEDEGFAKRCIAEMGYVPYKLLRRTSPFDLEFVPLIESLHADPMDPLDP